MFIFFFYFHSSRSHKTNNTEFSCAQTYFFYFSYILRINNFSVEILNVKYFTLVLFLDVHSSADKSCHYYNNTTKNKVFIGALV